MFAKGRESVIKSYIIFSSTQNDRHTTKVLYPHPHKANNSSLLISNNS